MEEVVQKEQAGNGWKPTEQARSNKPVSLAEITADQETRIPCPDKEFNRVLGGGLVAGSLVLIGGEPGVGKSTLMLQVGVSLKGKKCLYVSGEESNQQIKMRADRMKVQATDFLILAETATQNIFQQVEQAKPDLLIIDSIQTLHSAAIDSAPGSVSQVKHCAGEMLKYAKESGTPVLLIGHITKDGSIAGPKILEHMVDTVLQFEGDRNLAYRILRTTKNRFGSTSEIGIYEMRGSGLREVSNPSEILISNREEPLSGVAIGASMEGNRPLLIEIQSLVSTANYGTPQRSSTGYDAKRLNMLLAVLEKRGGYRLGIEDVFLNIAGGIKVDDPAMDLAVCVSLISSFQEIPVPEDICFAAEVGLGGEIRAVSRIESRISEAEKLGFKQVYISKFSQKNISKKDFKIEIKTFAKLSVVCKTLF